MKRLFHSSQSAEVVRIILVDAMMPFVIDIFDVADIKYR
jgi:hypothetical protein